MARRPVEGDWERYAESEANALAQLLAGDLHCVMVIVIRADSDEAGSTLLMHAVSGTTKGSHLRQFIQAVERQLGWLRDKLFGKA